MTRGNRKKCYYCGAAEKCTKDHFYPKSKKGTLTVYACGICQGSKRDMNPLEWIHYLDSHPLIDKNTLIRVHNAVVSLINLKRKKDEKGNPLKSTQAHRRSPPEHSPGK